ncbi:Branched-chain-amino-acid aminotransferase, mitochondrial [Frankliniella fusca]|uniref:Branched-chain-amino-acid aminotransferase, mitochondrial n=1 Tax=Frankliniella fusca TaxID=407009 RepID=A0AAE1L902_9NEOP|nr:Branched-chain-amino-acid aminotransferase, mitochondrial [Frankliniella fusca]
MNEMLGSRNKCENSSSRPAEIVLQSFMEVQKMIHVNVHHFKNSAHQIEVKLTQPFSAGIKLLFTHSVRLVNVSITLFDDFKSRGGSQSPRLRRPWLKEGRRHSARASSSSNKSCLHNMPI